MTRRITLAVLGGDKRQIAMVHALISHSYSVYTWGLPEESLPDEAHTCNDWEEALKDAQAVILPLPASRDGVRIFSPFLSEKSLRLDILLQFLTGKLVLGGRIPDTFSTACQMGGIACIDYYESEILQLKNALPTAEGAIEIAMRELPVVLDGIKAAVIGYGRIGELLSQKLYALGAEVTVFARREEVLARAELAHCKTVRLTSESECQLTAPKINMRVIFNTAPARLFTARVLERLPRNCILIDLASAPGGIDMEEAERLGIRAIWGTALPGKYAPESAGIILAQTAESILKEHFHFE